MNVDKKNTKIWRKNTEIQIKYGNTEKKRKYGEKVRKNEKFRYYGNTEIRKSYNIEIDYGNTENIHITEIRSFITLTPEVKSEKFSMVEGQGEYL